MLSAFYHIQKCEKTCFKFHTEKNHLKYSDGEDKTSGTYIKERGWCWGRIITAL